MKLKNRFTYSLNSIYFYKITSYYHFVNNFLLNAYVAEVL